MTLICSNMFLEESINFLFWIDNVILVTNDIREQRKCISNMFFRLLIFSMVISQSSKSKIV